MAKRLKAMNNIRYTNEFKLTLHEDLIDAPKKWRSPSIIFVNSMSDLFHEEVPLKFIRRVFETMNECPQHTFQILTKRSERLKQVAHKLPWSNNIWMGVSVENKKVMHRIDDLVTTPARIKFLSLEPLLGTLKDLNLHDIDWVIVGGESGPKARPMKKKWVKSILKQCRENDVDFFFKQWGGVNKRATGRTLNGRIYDEMPQRQIQP
tara:strand:+ start:14680 stop:15300 length:621 start_codon:yes stop_codon:yes gene_type:complete